MSKTTFSVQFYARNAKVSKKTGLTPLEMSIIINGKRMFLNLPYKVKPEDYQKKRKPKEILSIEEEYRHKVNEIILDLMKENLPVTVNTIREYIKTGGTKTKELQDLWKEYLSVLRSRIGTSIKESVYRKYELARDVTYELLGQSRELTTITNSDVVKLYEELKRRYQHSTAAGYFTKIKTVIVYAFDNGYIKMNPTNGIRIDKGHPKIEYLTAEELKRLEEANLYGNERLEKVRDILLFQAYTGMAYCDACAFDNSLVREKDGVSVYTNTRIKTGIQFTTIVFPKALEILKKYGGNMNIISNQKLNVYAKEIQTLAKIGKNLHSHLMRKTFATMLIRNSVPMSTCSKMLGHSNSAITSKIYAFTEEDTVIGEVTKAFGNRF